MTPDDPECAALLARLGPAWNGREDEVRAAVANARDSRTVLSQPLPETVAPWPEPPVR